MIIKTVEINDLSPLGNSPRELLKVITVLWVPNYKDKKMTELDVINFALAMTGERPLNDAEEGHPLVPMILQRIKEERIKLLMMKRWWFCHETVTLLPDASSGVVYVPLGTASISLTKKRFYNENIVQVGRRLYNTNLNTFVLNKEYECNIVFDRDFDDLPLFAQIVIQLAVGKSFQRDFDADSQRYQQIVQEYNQYLGMLDAENTRQRKVNLIRSPGIVRKLYDINGQVVGGLTR